MLCDIEENMKKENLKIVFISNYFNHHQKYLSEELNSLTKGNYYFIETEPMESERLDRNKYKIMLVGTDENIDKNLPDNIISIHRTQNQNELAEIYSAADLFVNPTREENYPTVNMESLACGTPVLTFNTGGSPEIIDETCGIVVEKDDIDSMYNEIINICENNVFTKEACLKKSKQFDMNERFKEYLQLYMSLCGEYDEQY